MIFLIEKKSIRKHAPVIFHLVTKQIRFGFAYLWVYGPVHYHKVDGRKEPEYFLGSTQESEISI